MTDDQQQREHFRVRYPITKRPKVKIDGCQYQIVELSKGGLRMSTYLGLSTSEPPETIYTEVTLACGLVRSISASYVRRDRKEFVLAELQGITPGDVMEEQQYLIRNDPMFGRD